MAVFCRAFGPRSNGLDNIYEAGVALTLREVRREAERGKPGLATAELVQRTKHASWFDCGPTVKSPT